MKKSAKRLISAILGWQVKRLQNKNKITVIAVAGSIGKTSTKFAIANVLKDVRKVCFQEGNYNDIVTVPLIFFGMEEPSVLNPIAWLKTILAIEKKLKQPYPFEIVVVELGTDSPGQIKAFSRYLQPDISVVTAVSPEHMEFFSTLENVAQEELSIAQFSKALLVNTDLVASRYLSQGAITPITYAVHQSAQYKVNKVVYDSNGSSFTIEKDTKEFLKVAHAAVSEPQIYSVTAAAAVADKLGLSSTEIQKGITNIKTVNGRLNQLTGIKDSLIIDDSYNASPQAMIAALDMLYRLGATQKIALLGNMNELGSLSAAAHTEVGEHCDPKQLELVVTLGPDANTYLAAAAKKKGCNVMTTTSPYEAAELIKKVLKSRGLILIKGSQNGVFAEEAVKELLADPEDQAQLVRQSEHWMAKKRKQFQVL